jgi:hypothetical protein
MTRLIWHVLWKKTKKPAGKTNEEDNNSPTDEDSDVIVVDDDEIVDEDVQCRLCSETSTHAMSEIGAIATSLVHMAGHAMRHIPSIARQATKNKNSNPKKKQKKCTMLEVIIRI